MGMISGVLLMGIIIFGTRKSSEIKELEKRLGKKVQDLDSNSSDLWKALEKSEEEKEKIFERLQNLEAIVTSEAWETVQGGEDGQAIRFHRDEDRPEDLENVEKAAKMAKRIR